MADIQNNEIPLKDYATAHKLPRRTVQHWTKHYAQWREASGIRLVPAPRPYYVIRADAEPLKLHRGRPRKPDHSPATHLDSDGDSPEASAESADLLENHTTK